MVSSAARLIAVIGVAVGLATAPVAAADPSDLVPPCSPGETPELDNCGTGCAENAPLTAYGTCTEPGTHRIESGPVGSKSPSSSNSGADPNVPLGPQ